jgi:hypothetical protein
LIFYKGHATELSPYQRGLVVAAPRTGNASKEIEDEYGLLQEAVRRTLDSIYLCNDGESIARLGAPLKYFSRAHCCILLILHSHLEMTYKQRLNAAGVTIGDNYIRGLVNAKGLQTWCTKKRLDLAFKVAAE